MKFIRNEYGAINQSKLSSRTKKGIKNLLDGVQKSEKIDEHGSWDFGAEFDKKGRGSALNWDLYDFGKDLHSKRNLIIIQVREYTSNKYGTKVRKSYFLIGRNEDNTFFAHCINTRVITAALEGGKSLIRAAQKWIFGVDYSKVLRQGDIALIPMKKTSHLKDVETIKNSVTLEGSHELKGQEIKKNGVLYALNPSIVHLPGTHPNFINLKGWYKIIIGKRGKNKEFAAPTID